LHEAGKVFYETLTSFHAPLFFNKRSVRLKVGTVFYREAVWQA
jgi:hypothetical protein